MSQGREEEPCKAVPITITPASWARRSRECMEAGRWHKSQRCRALASLSVWYLYRALY